MSEILFSVATTEPEAFDIEWEEWNKEVESSVPIERAPEDFVREMEESGSFFPQD